MTNENRVLRLPDAQKKVGLSKGSIYRLMKINQFPKPIKLGVRARGWLESDLDMWINQRRPAMANS